MGKFWKNDAKMDDETQHAEPLQLAPLSKDINKAIFASKKSASTKTGDKNYTKIQMKTYYFLVTKNL